MAFFGLLQTYKDRLLPASFRGVPFLVKVGELTGGRRGVVHEFPLQDRPRTEDMGGAARRFTLEAYVIGDDYDVQRDALIHAVFDTAGPGTLVHPYLGSMQVQMLPNCSVREQQAPGRIASFRLACVDAGTSPLNTAVDTSNALLTKALAVLGYLQTGFALAVAIQANPALLTGFLAAGAGLLATDLFGLNPSTVADAEGLIATARSTIAGLQSAYVDAPTLATAVVASVQATANAIIETPPTGADPTGGLAALATWSGIALPANPVTTLRLQQQTNAQAMLDLVQGSAVAAIAQVYANTDFPSADAADAARAQLAALIDLRSDAAAAAGDDASYAAWLDLGAGAVADLSQRAQALPRRASYATPASLPSLALAWRLYQDAGQADALDQLNDVPHPGFMPAAGVWLEPVAS